MICNLISIYNIVRCILVRVKQQNHYIVFDQCTVEDQIMPIFDADRLSITELLITIYAAINTIKFGIT